MTNPDEVFQRMKIDPRDQEPGHGELVAPHGHAQYCVVSHVPGRSDRATIVRTAHAAIRDLARREEPPAVLCGIDHQEDVEMWQLPHSLRPAAKEVITRARGQYGRLPVVLVRVWQHHGPCVEEVPHAG